MKKQELKSWVLKHVLSWVRNIQSRPYGKSAMMHMQEDGHDVEKVMRNMTLEQLVVLGRLFSAIYAHGCSDTREHFARMRRYDKSQTSKDKAR